jgi:hypothetical protein
MYGNKINNQEANLKPLLHNRFKIYVQKIMKINVIIKVIVFMPLNKANAIDNVEIIKYIIAGLQEL